MAAAALVVSIIALGWQVLSWLATQRPRVRLRLQLARASPETTAVVIYDDAGVATAHPATGSLRMSVLLSVMNLGINPFEVTAVTYRAEGRDNAIGIAGLPAPDPSAGIAPTIPGPVQGHSRGIVWVYVHDLEEAFGPAPRVFVSVELGDGRTWTSDVLGVPASEPTTD